MTSRLRQLAERAEKVKGEREAWRAMMAGIRQRQIFDLMYLTSDEVIDACRAIHSGGDDGWLARIGASLADATDRWEAGERPRWAGTGDPSRPKPATASGDLLGRGAPARRPKGSPTSENASF